MYILALNETHQKYSDASCSDKLCFICAWKNTPTFTMRGLCSNTKVDDRFFMLPQFTFNQNVFFFGSSKTNILYDDDTRSWLIVEDKIQDLFKTDGPRLPLKIVGTLQLDKSIEHNMPVGQHFWNLTDKCNQVIPLKLTYVSLTIFLNYVH